MKGTKEKSRFTLNPPKYSSPYNDTAKQITFKEYLKGYGFLSPSKTKDAVDPYFRFKLFSSSKFNPQKYEEDRESILDYYNAEGFRDAAIVDHKEIPNAKGNLDLHIKVNEGHKYYFGDIAWRGNTKYTDSVLNLFLGIKKGDIYNLDLIE